MKIELSIGTLVAMVVLMIALVGENVYLEYVNEAQAHTIRQYMGLEAGPDATPQPPVLPPYIPPVDSRLI
jgi:hypothetical protein